MRTAHVVDALLKRNHSVVWWSSCFDHFTKTWVADRDSLLHENDQLSYKLLKGIGYKSNVSPRRFIDHRILAKSFKKQAEKMLKPDVLVVSMPAHDIAYEAVQFAVRHRIPVIVDIRDPWPDIFLNHCPSFLRPVFKRLFKHEFDMTTYLMSHATVLLAVTSTFLNWGLAYAGRPKTALDQVLFLGGETHHPVQPFSDSVLSLKQQTEGKFVVLFFGTFAFYHNPLILIEVAKRCLDKPFHFIVAGNGQYYEDVKKAVEGLSNVSLIGWTSNTDIQAILTFSHVGICPTSQDADLFPNKAFTYLSAGLPVVSAFKGDLFNLIEDKKIGFNYEAGHVQDLKEKIELLYTDKVLYEKMSAAASTVFEETCKLKSIISSYVETIEKISEEHP